MLLFKLPVRVARAVESRSSSHLYFRSRQRGAHDIRRFARINTQTVFAGIRRQREYVARFDLFVVFVPSQPWRGHADHLTLQGHDAALRELGPELFDENRFLERFWN